MQQICSRSNVALWPHVKTHKCVAIARRQLEQGAAGLTCAKLSEAEAMLPSGVRRVFIAYSLSTSSALERAGVLQQKLDELVLAVTSLAHARALALLVEQGSFSFPIAIAVDTGLGLKLECPSNYMIVIEDAFFGQTSSSDLSKPLQFKYRLLCKCKRQNTEIL